MAEPFQHISGVAVKVLARIAARKAVVEQLRANGIRRPVPHREIVRATNAYLAANPRLYEQALATAWELSVRDQSGRINAVLFDDNRRGGASHVALFHYQITPNRALKTLQKNYNL